MTAIPPTFRRQDLREAPGSRTPQAAPASADVAVTSKSDHSSQKHLLKSLSSSWIAHGVQIVSGFILPRLISDELGQGVLGVWDFGWATVSYFNLLQGGIVSSVNRYVARHRAAGNIDALNTAVSSVGAVLKGIAIVIAVLTAVLAWVLPTMMTSSLGGLIDDARWVLLLLGLTIAVQVQGAVYGGVLTGCHAWTVHNGLKSIAAMLSVVTGTAVIVVGGNIVWLAAVMLAAEILLRCAQRVASAKICPELRISLRHFSRSTALEMSRFGGKTYVNVISQLLVNQTSSILVASTFGVAALAVFARPRSLVRTVRTLVDQSASILVPTVSALDAAGRLDEIRHLAISATRYAMFACLPAILLLTAMGGDVLHLWMGDGYTDAVLIAIFAAAGFAEACCFPLQRILMGLNCHGRIGLMNLCAATTSVVLAMLVAWVIKADLRWMALAIVLPSLLVNGVLLPVLAACAMKMGLLDFIVQTATKPLLCILPAAAAVGAISFLYEGRPFERLLVAFGSGIVASGWLYWRNAVPPRVKELALKWLRHLRGAPPNSKPAASLDRSPRTTAAHL